MTFHSVKFFVRSSKKLVEINSQDVFRKFLIWLLLMSPSKPKNFLSIAKSISSENRSIRFQPLLNEVPPLKTVLGEYFNSKEAFNANVTHQSFSMAIAGILKYYWLD